MTPDGSRGDGSRRDALLAALDAPTRRVLEADVDLERWLEEGLAAARDAWPALPLADEVFLVHLAARMRALPDPKDYRALHLADLRLACACLQGCPMGIDAFARRHGASMTRAMARAGVRDAAAEELSGALREKLFFGEHPLLASYSGRGRLSGWLRAVAYHAAVNESAMARRHVDLDEALDAPDARVDIELAYLKTLYTGEFRASLAHAVQAMSPRDRTLLRQHHLDGSTIDELGRLHGVHRATAAEWLVRARQALAREVRRDLAARLSLSNRELESLLRVLRTDFRSSILAVLR